jgi:cytoplasmic tRNA 2-thiolation protein 1
MNKEEKKENTEIKMYGTSWCADCFRAKNVFDKYNIKYEYIDIDKMSEVELKANKIKSVVEWRKKAKLKLLEYKGGKCERCGYISSKSMCKACVLLDGLNSGEATAGIGRSRKHLKIDTTIYLK